MTIRSWVRWLQRRSWRTGKSRKPQAFHPGFESLEQRQVPAITNLALAAASDTGIAGDRITSITRPTLTGVAAAGRTVQIFEGATLRGSGTANATTGAFTVTLSSALSAGSRTLTAKEQGSTTGPTLTLTIDNVAPTAPPAPTLVGAASPTPTFTGTAESGATVNLFARNSAGLNFLIGQGTATGGTYTITASSVFSSRVPLAAGSYSITVTAVDRAGNVGRASAVRTLTVPGSTATPPAAPTVSSFSASAGKVLVGSVTNDTQPTVNGTAVASATVRIFDGATQLGSVTASGTGAWSFRPSTGLGNGSHTITATATVGALTSAASSSRTLTVDTVAPVVSSAGLAGASDSGASGDLRTNVTTPTFTGTAEAGSTVRLFVGASATPLGQATAAANGQWSITTPGASAFAEGTHSIRASATDTVGNTTNGSTVSLVIDTTAPSAGTPDLAAANDSGTSNTDDYTNQLSVTLSGTAEAGSTVELFKGSTSLGTTTASGGGAWTLAVNLGTTGAHALTAKATDAAGNTGSASATLTVTVDQTAPTLTTSRTPAANANGWNNSEVTASFTASDDSGFVSSASGSQTFSAEGTGLSTSFAAVTDKAGNSATPSVTGINIDTTAPTATISSGPSGTVESIAADFAFATADARSGVATVEYRLDGGAWSPTGDTLHLDDLADGAHTLDVRATDQAGNVSSTDTSEWTVQPKAPDAPTDLAVASASDTGTSSSDRLTNDTTPTITGQAEAGTTIKVYDDTTLLGTTTTGEDGSWSFTPSSALAEGDHSLSATATNGSGKTSADSESIVVTIDTTGPSIASDLSPDPNEAGWNNSSVTLTFEATDDNGIDPATAATGTSTFSHEGGNFGRTILVRDNAGNSTEETVGVKIDKTSPILSVNGPADGSETNETDAVFDLEGSDSLSGVAGFEYQLTGGEGGSEWLPVDGNSIAFSDLTDGVYTLEVRAIDVAGNTSEVESRTWTVDTTPPPVPADLVLDSDTGDADDDGLTNNATPTISGTGEAGSTITVYLAGSEESSVVEDSEDVPLGTTTVAEDGTWSFTVDEDDELPDGTHDLYATASDHLGNESTGSDTLTIRVDTVAPTITTNTSPEANENGWHNSPVTISYEASDDVELSGDSSPTGISTIMDDGPDQSVSFTVADAAGNETTVDVTGINLDQVAPSASIDEGPESLTNSNTANFAVSGSDDLSGVDHYEYRLSGAEGGWEEFEGSNLTLSDLADGEHTLEVRAVDLAGNASEADTHTWTVDTTAPEAPTVDLETSSDSGESDSDNITRVTQPVISGTAETGSVVTVYNGETEIGTTVADESGNWNLPVSTDLSNGTHTLWAEATDAAGNTSDGSEPLEVLIDTVKPTIAAGRAEGSEANEDGWNNDEVTVEYTASDDGSGLASTSPATGTGTVSGDGLSRSVVFTVRDKAGNTATAVVGGIKIDTEEPDGDAFGPEGPINEDFAFFHLHGYDDLSGVKALAYRLDSETEADEWTLLDPNDLGDGDACVDIVVDGLQDGDHVLEVRVIDLADNTHDLRPYHFTVDTVAPEAPAVDEPLGPTGASTPTVSGTAEAGLMLAVFGSTGDSGTRFLGFAWAQEDGTWSLEVQDHGSGEDMNFDRDQDPGSCEEHLYEDDDEGGWDEDGEPLTPPEATDLGEGTWTIWATAVDEAGNESEGSNSIELVIDRTAPEAPTLALSTDSDSGMSDSDLLTNMTSLTFTGTAEAGSTVVLLSGETQIGEGTADEEGNFSIEVDASEVDDGGLTVTATATDAAANTSDPSSAVELTLDTVAPSASIDGGPEAPTAGTVSFEVSGDEDATMLEYSIDGGETWTAVEGDSVEFSELEDGDYTLLVRATDAAGNASEDKSVASFNFTIDNTDPTVTVDGPTEGTVGAAYNFTFAVEDLNLPEGAQLTVNWGDGDVQTIDGPTNEVTHTYESAGVFGIGVSVTDAAGNVGLGSHSINITGGES